MLQCFNFLLIAFEEIRLLESEVGDKKKWLKEGMDCNLLLWNGKVIDLKLPITVKLSVVDVDPGLKGDIAQAMIDNVPSVDNLDFIMESDALRLKPSILTLLVIILLYDSLNKSFMVNSVGAEVLEFIADFGKPTAPLPAAMGPRIDGTKIHDEETGIVQRRLANGITYQL
ncbi:hypothetical protein K1719_027802 [Acacia pycnantha]|nr:hypothetical protein K1719_027802 [Acacia pycnantha]